MMMPSRRLRPLILLACLGSAQVWSSAVLASDAYDDDQREERPSGESFEDEDDSAEDELTAGGLVVPSKLSDQGDRRSAIERDLDEADEKDAGRGLSFAWLAGNVGYGFFGLNTLGAGGLLGPDERGSARGPLVSVGAGVRLLYFTTGARFRYGFLSNYNLLTLLLEVGVRIPLGALEPYVAVGGGYAAARGIQLQRFSESLAAHGGAIRLAGGVDYFFSETFSVGAELSGEALFLRRAAQDASESCSANNDCPYLQRARATGAGVSMAMSFGFHF